MASKTTDSSIDSSTVCSELHHWKYYIPAWLVPRECNPTIPQRRASNAEKYIHGMTSSCVHLLHEHLDTEMSYKSIFKLGVVAVALEVAKFSVTPFINMI